MAKPIIPLGVAVTLDGSVTGPASSTSIATNAVGTTQVSDSAITTAKVADSAITSGKIADGTIVNADISASAGMTRSKLASGTASHVIINDASGVMSSEATLAVSRGGTGLSTPGTSGNVLTSDGTGWVSSAPAAGGTYTYTVANSAIYTVGDCVAMGSGGLAKADYSTATGAQAIGIVTAKPTVTSVTVAFCGDVVVNTSTAALTVGTPLYVGSSGALATDANVTTGKYATLAGYVSTQGAAGTGRIAIQITRIGQKA